MKLTYSVRDRVKPTRESCRPVTEVEAKSEIFWGFLSIEIVALGAKNAVLSS